MTRLGFTSYTSNGIFQLLLLVLLGVIIPQKYFKKLKNSQLFYYDNSEKIYYRVAIKVTKNDEIFVKSVVKGDNLIKEIKNKQRTLQES